ncbi:S-adenosyl-L-methionine-dependent methyltransferase [Choanephora cucurbitarum]|nr:S-adenosyl-L-methionine-dependent methyltransferase [Choanephora cucurbitarum]
MLVREFLDDSLYNPHYGFYTKDRQRVEYTMKDQEDSRLGRVEHVYHTSGLRFSNTELFKPWYAHAIARYMVSEYKLKLYPHKDLIIYEIGGKHGRWMTHILDYIQRYEPSVYKRTQYNMIELPNRKSSPTFLHQQNDHHATVNVLNTNIFDWNTLVTDHCFFLGMKVINHFAHDVIRYHLETMKPYQGLVCVGPDHQYKEIFEPIEDPVILKYLNLRNRLNHRPQQLARSNWYHRFQHWLTPSHHKDLTRPEFIPTRLFEFMEILSQYFPRHRLILTDYESLSHTMKGINAPLVQTELNGIMTPSPSYLMRPGWYDVMFPTNFELLRDMYMLTCYGSKPGNEKSVRSIKYSDFLERYGEFDDNRQKKSMALCQPNVKVFLT